MVFDSVQAFIAHYEKHGMKIPELNSIIELMKGKVLYVDGDESYHLGEALNNAIETTDEPLSSLVRWINSDGYGYVRLFSVDMRKIARFAQGGTSISAPYNCYLVEVN